MIWPSGTNTSMEAVPGVLLSGDTSTAEGSLLSMCTVTPPWLEASSWARKEVLPWINPAPTVAGKKPSNFFHFLLDNECYATTGGQPVPNALDIDYAGMAKSAGYRSTHSFDDLEEFVTNVGSIMEEEGPVFISVKIVPEVQNLPISMRVRTPSRSRTETVQALQEELGISNS